MARASLITLPPELLFAICSNLCWHCLRGHTAFRPSFIGNPDHSLLELWEKQMGLLSLSKVCKMLHVAAEPFHYHFLRLSREWDLYFLTRTLSERSDLAAKVFEVDIAHISRAPSTTHHGSHDHDSPTSQDWAESIQHAALILLLLRLAPNMERLYLPVLGIGPFSVFPQQSSHESSSSLKTLAFSSFELAYLLDQVSPIVRQAPNLEILHCHKLARVTELFSADLGRKTLAEEPPLRNLSEVALIDTSLTVRSFRNLLSVVGPRLSKVSIRRTARTSFPDDEEWILEFDEALAALQPWRHTLKELFFTTHGSRLSMRPRRLDGVNLLREFHALEVLWAQSAFFDFYGHLGPKVDALTSTLPASLRELRLFGYSNLGPALRGLVARLISGQAANLRSVEIDDQGFEEYEPTSEPAQELRDVAASFRSAGVGFIVHPQPEEPETFEQPDAFEGLEEFEGPREFEGSGSQGSRDLERSPRLRY
ncbi:hypothetical protein B0I37DRAFT_362269, partial [Chaetomium sp. MPI-CAGE-AT-0009]